MKFSFTYADSVVPVSIKLTNLASNDVRLVDAENDGVFVFTPTSDAKTQTISLKTNSWGSKIGVEIVAAEGYNVPVSVTANRTISTSIKAQNLGGGNGGNNQRTVEYYLTSNTIIGTVSLINNQSVNVILSGDFGQDGSQKLYFKSNNRIASTTLANLADGSATLYFSQQ